MSQFQSQVPGPLGYHLPALLSPGRMRAPAIRLDLLVLIKKRRLKGPAMQIQFDDIGGGACLLRQVGEEEFVDDTSTRDANRTLLFRGGMGGHHHTAAHAIGSHRDLWAIVEAADHLAFWALLELIWRKVQACLNERVIEHTVLFAAGDKREACHIGEDGPGSILPVKPKQGVWL